MQYQINVTTREQIGKGHCRKLRVKGLVPGIIYGHGRNSLPVYFNYKEFFGIMKKAGESTVIELNVNGEEKLNALVKEYQLSPLDGHLLHVDFYTVRADEVVTLNIPIHLIGESIGVKQGGGILETIMRELEIQCFPADIPEKIEINISNLAIGDEIMVKDIPLSEKVKVLNKPDSVVVLIEAPAVEEVVQAAPEEAAQEPEVIKKGKEATAKEEGEEEQEEK
jgi:large subunit ribosomal protein L25